MESLDVFGARRLALARAGLLNPRWTGLPNSARGNGKRAREASHAVVRRFGYLQLDTVSIAGARSHALVLLSRLEGLSPELPENLLRPGEPLFEYWGHEASWLPMELYPVLAFRRRDFREHPWWGDLIGENPEVADNILRRIRNEGPLRSVDLEGRGSRGWWDLKIAKKVASHLWSSGVLAIRQRKNFQRSFDLAERVIPSDLLQREVPFDSALKTLLLRALAGHGWAQTGTLASTWRLRNLQKPIATALSELVEDGEVQPCSLQTDTGRQLKGWIRPADLELAARLRRVRPARDRGVLLSPFDPVLWDRPRVKTLFDFEQLLEIFKPAPQRVYGYYCLPVLAGDRLVARYDLKADRKQGALNVLSLRFETEDPVPAVDQQAARSALERYAEALKLRINA
ncbi:MAG: crosslink repair DNA glycosylase YcaQ family protein [Acidobacteriota bacterium]